MLRCPYRRVWRAETVYKGRRIVLVTAAYDEEQKIGEVIRRVPRDVVDRVLVIDDGSTDLRTIGHHVEPDRAPE